MKSLEAKPQHNNVRSRSELKAFQQKMLEMLYRPLSPHWKSRKKTDEGISVVKIAEGLIKPNDRLTSFERLEIYNRCYWFRVLDSLYDDFPGLLALLGNRKFLKLITAYLIRYPSESFTLRNLGSRLESFLCEEPEYASPLQEIALDMVRFEWAQIIAFDEIAREPISPKDIQKRDPEKLRIGLQPYLALLELNHAVDRYLIAVKNQEFDGLRKEASNTSNAAPEGKNHRRRLSLPKRERVWLAVHRYDNMLYYKRLEPAAFTLLKELGKGTPLEMACGKAIKRDGSAKQKGVLKADAFQEKLQGWFAEWSSLRWLTLPSPKK